MKKLIWKELMEMRLIPLAYAALAVVVELIWYTLDDDPYYHYYLSEPETVLKIFVVGICAAGLFSGSSAIAPEVGRGTLKFLSSLPAGRLQIWRAKFISGLLVALASILFMAVSLSILGCLLFGPHFVTTAGQNLNLHPMDMLLSFIQSIGVMTVVYSVSLLVSVLVDSALTATILSLVTSVALVAGIFSATSYVEQLLVLRLQPAAQSMSFYQLYGHSIMPAAYETLGLSILFCLIVCLVASRYAFTNGGTLLTRKRFYIAGSAISAWLIVVVFLTFGLFAYCDHQVAAYKEQYPFPVVDADYKNDPPGTVEHARVKALIAWDKSDQLIGSLKAVPSCNTVRVTKLGPPTKLSDGYTYVTVWIEYVASPQYSTISLVSPGGKTMSMIYVRPV
jgi:ABC-type transport system involved in multi-copper enzyme maturation permease subunit